MHLVVMGVSGCGKTTLGRALAGRLGRDFEDADDWHPPANREQMRQGIPLGDRERQPWLETLAGLLAERAAAGRPLVLACSALKEVYRDILRRGDPELAWLWLRIDPATCRARLASRGGHFMPASLADSQFAALEPPAGPRVLELDGCLGTEQLLERILAWPAILG
jgi:gluconokinase